MKKYLILLVCFCFLFTGCSNYSSQITAPSETTINFTDEELPSEINTSDETITTRPSEDIVITYPTEESISNNNDNNDTVRPTIPIQTPTTPPTNASSNECSHMTQLGPNSYQSHLESIEHSNMPTCTKAGYWIMKCNLCKKEVDKIYSDALGHTIDSTCTKKPHCTSCGEQFDGEVNSNDHRYIEYNTKVGYIKPTCISEGYEGHKKVCMNCNFVFEYGATLPIDPNNHSHQFITKNKVEATCLKNGYSGDLYCKDCETIIYPGKVTERKHKNDIPTCIGQYCSVCNTKTSDYAWTSSNNTVQHLNIITKNKNIPAHSCQDGYTGDTYCTGCKKILEKGEKIQATQEHNYIIISEEYSGNYYCKKSQCTICGSISEIKISIGE